MDYKVKSPVLFLVFNRPDTTQKVFDAIKKVKPKKLYVAADGPRENKEGEKEKCEEVRNIIKQVDWDCKVETLFREKNLGCRDAVSSAITWFFDNVEEGIILEDDCLPSTSFFRFCDELLERYRDDTRVWHIGGTNPLKEKVPNSYYFSKYNRIWGWATWRRCWENYDKKIIFWPDVKKQDILLNVASKKEVISFTKKFDAAYYNKINTWDFQWALIKLLNGLSVIPCVNLVSNIGFSDDATHTKIKNDKLSDLKRFELDFPLVHPPFYVINRKMDDLWNKYTKKNNSLLNRILLRLLK